jgi:amino acid adenylation domain-containing protein/non-ribosomal peptide synthase protein (TIGR01720 family)
MQEEMIKGFRLSPQQKHLWLLQQEEQGFLYRTQCAVLIEGNLNVEALKVALQTVVNRHEILRTAFHCLPGKTIPLQFITDSNLPPIHKHNLSDLASPEQATRIEAIFQETRQLHFDFEPGSNLHLSLVILSPNMHLLILSLPALCADSVTLNKLVHEISYYYAGLPSERLDSEPMQYVDFSEWQNELLAAEDTEKGREYWRKQDISASFNLKLPFETKSAEYKRFKPESITITLQPHTVAKLEALVQQYNTSTSVFLLTIWHILLWRLTGQSDIIIGKAYDGRQHEELKESLGLLTKYLPIPSNLEDNLQFFEVLERLNEAIFNQLKWQDYFNWENLLRLKKPRLTPFFSLCFEFDKYQKKCAKDVIFSIYKKFNCIDRFKIKLSCIHQDDVLIAEFYYDSNLFRGEDIKRWAGQFQILLESAVENPLAVISELDILSEIERQQLLFGFNNTETNYPKSQCIHQLFEKQTERTPDNVAVVFENQQLTYAQLNARANQLARYLQELGVGPEVLVVICMERSLEMVIGLMGILKAGGAYVPLDPVLPKERLAFILEDTQASVLLTGQQWSLNLPECGTHLVFLDTDWDVIAQKSNDNFVSEVTSENLVYTIYTSGSTGKPKGVAVEHRQLLNYLNGILAQLDLPTGASFALISTFAADLGNTVVFPALCTGGCLHVISQERASDPSALANYYRHHGGIDCLKIVPTHLRALLSSCSHPAQILPRHRLVLGGEASSWDLVEKLQALASDCTILNHYGPTETTVGVLTYRVENGQTDCRSATVPLGRPLPNTQVFLLDEHRRPVPIGVPGELYIGGANLARGYFNRPDLTKDKFIPNPFSNPKSERLYKTGDLARYLPDGNIEFLGRLDNQVKIRGFRIELGEIETALRQHPAVRETAVIVLDNELGEQRLVAYVVPNQKQAPTIGQLRSFLQEHLPDYMIPSTLAMLDALPLMPNGKLDRQALPALDWTSRQLEAYFIAPRTPEEKLLANIWAEVLGVEQMGVQDNFFELGGDSILSIQIVARAREVGLRLTPMQLFHHQTIAELAAVASKTPSIQTEQGLVTGQVHLTPIQQWFFEQNLPEPHHWNMSILLETPPTLNPKRLEQVLQHLLEHHDVLRLRFEQEESGWQQIHASADKLVPFSRIDLSALPEPEQASAIETEVAKMQTALNLSTAPVMRVALFDLGSHQPGRLLIVIHHLVMDGISWRIWLEDFQRVYQQLSRGEAIQLPAKTTSFKDWAERLGVYAQSAELRQELDYWLANSQKRMSPLPRDYFEQPNTVASAHTVSVSLSMEDTQALLQQVPAAYKTQINDLLLTALVQAFRQWTRKNTLLVELEGHGRETLFDDIDVSRTIGWFTTRFPILLDLGGVEVTSETSNTIDAALKSVKEQLRWIPNRGLSYGLLRYLNENPEINKKLQAFPQPEVSFNYLGQFDRVLPESTPFRLAKESLGAERSLQGTRTHLIAIDGIVLEGRLQLDWTYSENVHRRATIENLTQNFIAALRGIIHHCLSSRGGYTPSDFPLAKLNQKQLERLSAKFAAIEDIYGLSPLQQGLLFHSLYALESRLYFQQKIFTLEGKLNVSAFKQAWQKVVNRHPNLRTAFIWEDLDEQLQVVLKQVEVPWEQQDWCHLSPSQQEEQLQAYLKADLQQGFSLNDAPLMRLALIQVAPDINQLIWSHHHLLLDGWCNSVILKEVFSFYEEFCQGQDLYLEPSPPYRDYIIWLQQQDWFGAEAFWRRLLSGVRTPTRMGIERVSGSLPNQDQGYAFEQIQLSVDVTSTLQSFARQHHLTLNTLMQGVWALLLSRYSGEEDVVFGVTVSGRPAELPGVESMVGLLINTLPVRVRVSPHVSLLSWLKQLQQQQAEMLEYQYSPLVKVQAWSEVPQGMPLFESFLTFENYPVDASLRERTGRLKILDIRFFCETNYPLSVTVELDSALLVRIDYASSRFDDATIRRMLRQIQDVLENIPVHSAYSLSNISLTPDDTETQQLLDSFNAEFEM